MKVVVKAHRLVLACAAATALAAGAPAPAAATDYCVPTVAACPAPGGTGVLTLQSALDAADNLPDADRIFLDSGTFTAPTTAGFIYNTGGRPVELHGSGSTGAGKTTLTAPTGSARVLELYQANATIDALAIDGGPDMVSGSVLLAADAKVSDTAVTANAQQTDLVTGVQLADGGSFEDGSVVVPDATNSAALVLAAPNTSVVRSALTGRRALVANGGAKPGSADRVRLTATGTGVDASGSDLTLTNSLVRTTTDAGGLYVGGQPGGATSLTARNVTVVGDGTPGSLGVYVSNPQPAPNDATLTLRNSIVTGYPPGRARVRSAVGTAAANMTATNSMFAPASSANTGPGAMVPAPGQLTPGANLDDDAQFEDPAGGDYSLQFGTTGLDAGDPGAATGLDLLGNPRAADGDGDCASRPDMGAYERFAPIGLNCPGPVQPPAGGSSGGSAGGGTTPPRPGGPARRDTRAPHISRLSIPKRLRAGKGVRLGVTLSERARISLTLTPARGAKGVRGLRLGFAGKPGRNRPRIPGRRVKRGRYKLTLVATDAAGNRSRRVTRFVRVRP